jgi:hypothetical protein
MDEASARATISRHADSVVAGDTDAVAADFSEELRPHLPQIAAALPQPTTAAEVVSIEFSGDEAVAMINYSGENGALTVRSQWREIGGRPLIVAAAAA